MRRLFWVGVGVAAGVTLARKATETARQATPAGLASNVGEAIRELAGAVGAFGADVRAGMNEREQELSDMVQQRSGVSTRQGRAPAGSATAGGRYAAARPHARRARRAEG
ncbi:hypothetical protein [Amycolatopsis aidingensis]|uniref:hypothetical protein n=1 Tax=Amycolatopsis aidingensis TaxID=2842453 RepID=UPI001C0BCFDB|nr:hypothetical protein [Amycolatopsis aidingensis]